MDTYLMPSWNCRRAMAVCISRLKNAAGFIGEIRIMVRMILERDRQMS